MGWAWKARLKELQDENSELRRRIEKLERLDLFPPTYCHNCAHTCLNPKRPLMKAEGQPPLRPIT